MSSTRNKKKDSQALLPNKEEKKRGRIIIGITGGSGVIYGIRLLEVLKEVGDGLETHLIISPAGAVTIKAETDYGPKEVEKLATKVYRFSDIAAPLASGSFRFESMVVIPCSMHTLGAIASGLADNLLVRAAEVALKEKHRLILVPRETPLTLIHLENMVKAAQAGAIVVPAMPAFYERPKSIDDIVNHLVGKTLDLLGIENELFKRWKGMPNT
jgi:4-hydroxy-3-polyprenylbenzoate decarboxylase